MLKHREDFYRVRGRIPDNALDQQTLIIVKDYGKYFDKFPDHLSVDFDVFLPLFRAWHSGLKDDKRQALEIVLSKAKDEVSEDTRQEVMRSLLELRLATTLANKVAAFEEGELPNLFHHISDSIQEYKTDAGLREVKFIDTDIDVLLNEENDDSGVQWRLDVLNQSMRPLRGGDFGIIAGRPDKGKTTFISSEITHMATQIAPDENILWLNNEGPGKRIIPRLYQSALGVTRTKLLELSARGVASLAYSKLLGRKDKIRVVDIHGMDNFAVEQIIEANNAKVVIYDMIDNIRGFGDSARTDLGLEKMYQWGREIAVKYDAIGLATSQISADGDGMQFPTLGMLKDSKTGKQGACDFMLMIGSSNDPGYSNVRWLGMPKNKLRLDTGPADPRAAVKYEPMRARYTDMPIMGDDTDATNQTGSLPST
jgi:replicative DNA helicase